MWQQRSDGSFVNPQTSLTETSGNRLVFGRRSLSDQQHRRNTHSFAADSIVGIQFGCLLVPVVLVVWWYWIKRSTREVITRVVDPDQMACTERIDEGKEIPDEEYSCW